MQQYFLKIQKREKRKEKKSSALQKFHNLLIMKYMLVICQHLLTDQKDCNTLSCELLIDRLTFILNKTLRDTLSICHSQKAYKLKAFKMKMIQ